MLKRLKSLFLAVASKKYKNKNIKIHLTSFVDSDCTLGGNNYIGPRCVLSKSSIGEFTYVSSRTRVVRSSIGKFCSIAQDCQIGGLARHPLNLISTNPVFYSKFNLLNYSFLKKNFSFKETDSVLIGNDVWIGARVMILDGVKIGDGAVIAAGAVVVHDVEPFQIVGGVPAKFIKNRLPHDLVKKIIMNPWWLKSIDEISAIAEQGYFLDNHN